MKYSKALTQNTKSQCFMQHFRWDGRDETYYRDTYADSWFIQNLKVQKTLYTLSINVKSAPHLTLRYCSVVSPTQRKRFIWQKTVYPRNVSWMVLLCCLCFIWKQYLLLFSHLWRVITSYVLARHSERKNVHLSPSLQNIIQLSTFDWSNFLYK